MKCPVWFNAFIAKPPPKNTLKTDTPQDRSIWELGVRLILLILLVPMPLTVLIVGVIVGKKGADNWLASI